MGRVYASADWHGCAEPAHKVFQFLEPDDKLYFLGDAIDRGDNGLSLFYRLTQDPRVVFLKGNHEDIMAKALLELSEVDIGFEYMDDWFNNGGKKTWDSMELLSDEERLKIANTASRLPIEVKYTSPLGHTVIMEHAGYTPWDLPHRTHDPFWDRAHFNDRYNSNCNNRYMVHGHTPVQYLDFVFGYEGQPPHSTKEWMQLKHKFLMNEDMGGWKPEVLFYCNDHKIDIDMCTISSGRIALLDLDSFDTIYFDAEDE